MRFEEQIMSKDKYPSNFQSQMEAIVLIKSQHGNIRSHGTFIPIARAKIFDLL